jgi:hypothetical protein
MLIIMIIVVIVAKKREIWLRYRFITLHTYVLRVRNIGLLVSSILAVLTW